MAEIETLNPTDQVNNSRTKINSNFELLNQDLEQAQIDVLARATQDQVQNASFIYAEDTGVKNALVITLSPTPTIYTTGMAVRVKVGNDNDDVCTINVNGLGVKSITKSHDQPLAAGDIEAGQLVDLVFDGTVFQMQSQIASVQALDFSTLNPQQGFLINGKIVTSVASNNLTVAIKTLADADPSASDVVYVRIGNSVRSITSALSVVLNAGANYFNAGSAELATKEIDYFVYLGYRASNASVFIGFSRVPYAITYNDINTTSTNELYLPYSGTAPATTDEMEVVGRFNAILSAGAGYTWSIPATSVVISRPIFETRWLDWVPQFAGFSAAPTVVARYAIRYRTVILKMDTAGAGASNATNFTITAPLVAANQGSSFFEILAVDNSAETIATLKVVANSSTMSLFKGSSASGAWTNTNNKYVYFLVSYEI